MNPTHRTGLIAELVHTLEGLEKKNPDCLLPAILVHSVSNEIINDKTTAADLQNWRELAVRIVDESPGWDEPAYSLYDYMDAVAYNLWSISPDRLNGLSKENFEHAMIWLASEKRMSYQGGPQTSLLPSEITDHVKQLLTEPVNNT